MNRNRSSSVSPRSLRRAAVTDAILDGLAKLPGTERVTSLVSGLRASIPFDCPQTRELTEKLQQFWQVFYSSELPFELRAVLEPPFRKSTLQLLSSVCRQLRRHELQSLMDHLQTRCMSNQARQVLSIYRFILRTLRHHAEAYHLYVDSRGWVSIKQLLQLINARSLELQLWRNWTATDLQRQASMDDRQRIEINDHYVRALYGHSLAHVSAGIPESPPHTLYHGTSVASLPEIAVQGLLPGTRCDVHLTSDLDYARLVSATHSDACVLVVRTDGPVRSGTLYRRANRHVWLTRCIPPESVSVLETVSATPAALRYIQQFNSIRQLNCVEVH